MQSLFDEIAEFNSSVVVLVSTRVELDAMRNKLNCKNVHSAQGLELISGYVNNLPCVVALMGVGKTNAAMTTALMIHMVNPQAVICAGVGGGLNPQLTLGDVVIATKVAQHDYGKLTNNGFEVWQTKSPTRSIPYPLYIPADTELLSQAEIAGEKLCLFEGLAAEDNRCPRIIMGKIVTGDNLVLSSSKRTELHEMYQADAIDMEGGAVVQVCRRLNVPQLLIRSIVDIDEVNSEIHWKNHMETSSDNASRLVFALLAERSRLVN